MSERGVFDLRIWVEGADELDVWRRVTEFQRTAALFSSPGVRVRYVQLRDGSKTRGGFEATMQRRPRKAAR